MHNLLLFQRLSDLATDQLVDPLNQCVYPYLLMATNAPWSIFGGMNKKLLKHVFALYSLPMIFSKNFLARYARSIAFYPQLTNASMQCVLPTLFIYFFYLLVSLSLTASFQSSLKTRTKLRIKCPKTVCGGGMGGGGE